MLCAASDPILSPAIQFGFAGFAAALLAVFVWYLKLTTATFSRMSERQDKVIAENTRAIGAWTVAVEMLHDQAKRQTEIIERLDRQLRSKPCMVRGDQED